MSDQRFWDDEFEMMTSDARRRLEDERLIEQIAYQEDLLPEAEAFAHRIASYPRVGVGWTKRTLHDGLDVDFGSAMRLETEAEIDAFRSRETKERFQGFVDRKRRE
ncbi:MAG: enoyl-CoA hydratase/isomerase family protein [Chloroflexota bacterium]